MDLAGDGRTILAHAELGGRQTSLPEDFRIATEEELQAVARCSGISIASHTWTHSNLRALSPSEVQTELETSMTWLQSRFRSFTPWLSYPYGLYSTDVARAAQRAGYAGAVRVEGGWLRTGSHVETHAIPRVNVPASISLDGFRMRLGGIAAK